jgi:hypothetical protein
MAEPSEKPDGWELGPRGLLIPIDTPAPGAPDPHQWDGRTVYEIVRFQRLR